MCIVSVWVKSETLHYHRGIKNIYLSLPHIRLVCILTACGKYCRPTCFLGKVNVSKTSTCGWCQLFFMAWGLDLSICKNCLILLAWKPFQISLSCMFHLLRKLGLVALPFKPISSSPDTAEPITEESHRSRHVSLLWLVVYAVQHNTSSSANSDQTVKLTSADQIRITILLLHCLFLPQMFSQTHF